MKNLIQFTAVLFLLVQTTGYSQTKPTETVSIKQDTSLKKLTTKTEVDTNTFIGTYFLVEADITLEIIQEGNKLYLVAPGSKDLLTQKNKTTLREPVRGVDLELIKDDKNALKFTQNGYETTINRVPSKN